MRLILITSPSSTVAAGICQCGCGRETAVARQTDNKRGYSKGQPMQYLIGHSPRSHYKGTLEERFWSRVRKSDGCWEFVSGASKGYGYLNIGRRDEQEVLAHRYSWELHNGPIPDGLLVLHRCDNPPCVRPDHLFLGTKKDNADDMVRKGRSHLQKVFPSAWPDILARNQDRRGKAEVVLDEDLNDEPAF
jgi:hypothetical protein